MHEHVWKLDEQVEVVGDGWDVRHWTCMESQCRAIRTETDRVAEPLGVDFPVVPPESWGYARGGSVRVDEAGPDLTGAQEGADLGVWWTNTAARDLEGFWPKLKEYGAHDLLTMGTALMPSGTDKDRTEAGIAMYILGKVSRLVGAYQEGRVPSDDTWLDVTVYSYMGRRVRRTGELS